MLTRLAYRIHTTLEKYLPEKRLFLRSDEGTRYIRLRPSTQIFALAAGTVVLGWTVIATSIVLIDNINAGSDEDQAHIRQALFEDRLTALSNDRDLRTEEAASAHERFSLALAQVSDMQSRLLASEDRRKELETGIDVIQNTLRRTIAERDEARGALAQSTTALAGATGGTEIGRARDALATISVMSGALDNTARERDEMARMADAAREETEEVRRAKDEMALRNDAIFARLEEAVTVSMQPLDKMFRAAGLNPDSLLNQVRRGYSGQGGPLTPFVSTKNSPLSADEARANTVLDGLDRMNAYRLAAVSTPFANPIPSGRYRFTSGFGGRSDPFGRGYRRHEGLDFAGPYGTAITATADGTVIKAGWGNGYGRMVQIRHASGVETLYAHMSQISVSVGQKVSRGDRIGDMGNSGRSTGTHLHYEVHVGGRPVNPMTFIEAARHVF